MFHLVVLLLAGSLNAQDWSVPCEPSSETLKSFEALPSVHDRSIPFEARVGPWRALAREHPDDFFVQRQYQDSFRQFRHMAGEYDAAFAMYRSRPANPLSRYLEARLLMLVDPARSKATFEELMAKYPRFVWPHADMIEWNQLPGRRDTKEVESHVKAFLAVCSSSIEIYEHFAPVQDAELLKASAAQFRRALVHRDTTLDTRYWPQLWALEKRAGVDEEALHARIRADLKRIGEARGRMTADLYWAHRHASEMLRDPSVLTTFEDSVAKHAPKSDMMLAILQAKWSRENPTPPRDATAAQQVAYHEKRAASVVELLKQWPANCGLAQQRWFRVTMRMPGFVEPSTEETWAAADQMLRCNQHSPDLNYSMPPIQTLVAEVYVRSNTRLDQVPRLLDQGLQAMERQEKYRLSDDLIPAEYRQRPRENNRDFTTARTQEIRADYFLAANRLEEARGLIEQELKRIEAAKSDSDSPEVRDRRARFARAQWLRRLGKIAETESRVKDALELYKESLAGRPRSALAQSGDPAVTLIRKYYLAHGGSEQKWLDWAASGAKETEAVRRQPALRFVEALPDFSAKDLAGRTWQLKDLRGKVTFINFWATWCGPCRGEHVELQALHGRLKERENFQILTLSVDEESATVASYIKEKGYTFPVIRSAELADKLFPYAGLPSNVLVNPEGRRTSMYPFIGGTEGLTRVIADMEKAAASPAQAP